MFLDFLLLQLFVVLLALVILMILQVPQVPLVLLQLLPRLRHPRSFYPQPQIHVPNICTFFSSPNVFPALSLQPFRPHSQYYPENPKIPSQVLPLKFSP